MRDKPSASGILAAPGPPTEPDGSASHHQGVLEPRSGATLNPADQSILLSLRAVPGSLFSFEALLVLYMFAGMYKSDPRFAWIPVDPTGLFFALSVLIGGWLIVWNGVPKRSCPIVFAMLALVAWWAVTLTWSPSRVYGPSKVFYLATLAQWALIAGALIVGPNPERVRRLFTLILLLATWVASESILIYAENPDGLFIGSHSDKYRPFGSYQFIGGISGLGALVAFTAWLFERRMSAKLVFLALFAGLAFAVTIAGAKGPVLQTSVAILLTLLLGLQVTRDKILYKRYGISIIVLVGALVAGLSIYIAAADHTPKSLQRLAGMIEAGELRGTAAYRATDYDHVFEFWRDAPLLGHGAGSWTILEHGVDVGDSPHNQALEVLLECGVVGLVLWAVLLVVALRPISLERLRNDRLALCAFILFLHEFLHAMRGGDVTESRTMFMLLGLLTMFTVRRGARRPAAASPAPALSPARQPRRGVASLSFGNEP
jgi:O-antigen ligase